MNNQIRAFLGEPYLPFKLSSELARFYGNSRTSAEMQADLDSIIAALAGKISECSKSNEIQIFGRRKKSFMGSKISFRSNFKAISN